MIITDLFDIDIHIVTVIKFLFNLVVKFKYIVYVYIYKSVRSMYILYFFTNLGKIFNTHVCIKNRTRILTRT